MLRVGRKRSMIHYEYMLHGKVLTTADSVKYIYPGVTSCFTSYLTWNTHIDSIPSKQGPRSNFEIGVGGGGGGTISDSIFGGTRYFFFLNLYNFKNIGGGTCPPAPPPTPRCLAKPIEPGDSSKETSNCRKLNYSQGLCLQQPGTTYSGISGADPGVVRVPVRSNGLK